MYKVVKNWKCIECPQNDLEQLAVKSFYIHEILTPDIQIFVRFALRLTISEIQGRQKSEKHRVTPNWTWTLICNSQKYPVYTKKSYKIKSAKFGEKMAWRYGENVAFHLIWH